MYSNIGMYSKAIVALVLGVLSLLVRLSVLPAVFADKETADLIANIIDSAMVLVTAYGVYKVSNRPR